MQNKLLSLGALAIVGSSAFAIVACNDDDDKTTINLTNEIDKIQDFDSVNEADNAKAMFKDKAVDSDVKAAFLALTEVKAKKYTAYTPYNTLFATGVKVEKVVVQTQYNETTKMIVLTVTIGYDGKTKTKDIKIRFGTKSLATEIAKLQDVTLAKSADVVATGENFGTIEKNDDDIKIKIQKIAALYTSSNYRNGASTLLSFALDANVSIEKIVVKEKYKIETATLVVTVTLTKENDDVIQKGSNFKDITITFGGVDLTRETAKLKSKITGVAVDSAAQGAAKDSDIKSFYESLTHLNSPANLESSVTIETIKVFTAYDSTTKTLVVTVKLTKSGSTATGIKYGTNTKNVTIVFA